MPRIGHKADSRRKRVCEMKKIFIDGSSGTTGLRIRERLAGIGNIELITLDESVRHDVRARADALNASDVSFLCLPDDAAKEAAALVTDPETVIIDTSTAHRTAAGWTYGFAELTGQREKIRLSKRIANPGCHASGFIALVRPLVEAGVLSSEAELSCFSLTGYSGGGKKMIAQYETGRLPGMDSPGAYGLSQNHKHLPEMKAVCGLSKEPVFLPVVSDYYAGMQVTVPLFAGPGLTVPAVEEIYSEYYTDGLVRFEKYGSGTLYSDAYSGKDTMAVTVTGNSERMLLIARFDNLGKGASGAAIQNMNIVLGLEETAGLNT